VDAYAWRKTIKVKGGNADIGPNIDYDITTGRMIKVVAGVALGDEYLTKDEKRFVIGVMVDRLPVSEL
jgi:hypothetical protein